MKASSSIFVGIDIGGTKTSVSLGTATAEVIDRFEFLTEASRGAERVVQRSVGAINEMMKAQGHGQEDICAVGISCGGPLDPRRGRILSPPNLPGWNDVPVVEWTESALGAPVRLENDANACAIAEWRFGAGKGVQSMVFLTFGTGMGAGLILDGKLISGVTNTAGEIGHVRISNDGPSGYGKIGSVESYCSGAGIAELARRELLRLHQLGETPLIAPRIKDIDDVTAKDVGNAARRGDPVALRVLEQSGRALGKALAIIVDLLNPQRIVVGSVYARLEEFIAPSALEVLEKEALPVAVEACTVVPAALGERVGDIAALSLAVEAAEGKS